MTELRINSILATLCLTGVVLFLVHHGQYATAGALAGTIATIATTLTGRGGGGE